MSREHAHDGSCDHCGCCRSVGRRDFMTTVGLSALATGSMLTNTSTAAPTASSGPKNKPKPTLRVAFVRPDVKEYWMGWPGASYDIAARQKQYTQLVTEAAKKDGVVLDVRPEPIDTAEKIAKLAAECKSAPPSGMLIISQNLNMSWPLLGRFCDERPQDLPTIVFSPMGTSFTGHLAHTRNKPRVLTAATQDLDWLAKGVHMIKAHHDMKHSRLLIMRNKTNKDQQLAVIGTTLCNRPLERWLEVHEQIKEDDAVKGLAAEFTKQAKKIVEPNEQDVLNSAKAYFIARRLMDEENCDGISLNCLGLLGDKKVNCGPCMAWGKLNSERSVGCCECDWNAAISLRLVSYLLEKPGFMQDPCPNTVKNTLMGAHCSSPWTLRGFGSDPEPLILRNHSESELGVSPQVIWPVGERMTHFKFNGPDKAWIGAGEVLGNIDTPPAGGCRTSVDVTVDGKPDTRDTAGFHQLFILGDHAKELQDYCEMAGIQHEPI